MNKRDKDYIISRLEAWGAWVFNKVPGLYYSDKNQISDLMMYRTRVSTNRLHSIPAVDIDRYNATTNKIIMSMREEYTRLAELEYAWHMDDDGCVVRRKLSAQNIADILQLSKSGYYQRRYNLWRATLAGLELIDSSSFS
jgi:hypothetical protein